MGITISPWMMAFLMLMTGFAGFVDSAAGGGGLISLPAYLFAGLPPHYTYATNKFSAACGTTFATASFFKSGAMNAKVGVLAAIGSFAGSALGAHIVLLLSDEMLRTMMFIILPVAAVIILWQRNLPDENRDDGTLDLKKILLALAIGLGIGLYDGVMGPGTGTFAIIAFTTLMGFDLRTANGNGKVLNLASNYASLFTYLMNGLVVFHIGIPCAVSNILGNLLGSHFALKKGARFIRPMMLVVLVLLQVKAHQGGKGNDGKGAGARAHDAVVQADAQADAQRQQDLFQLQGAVVPVLVRQVALPQNDHRRHWQDEEHHGAQQLIAEQQHDMRPQCTARKAANGCKDAHLQVHCTVFEKVGCGKSGAAGGTEFVGSIGVVGRQPGKQIGRQADKTAASGCRIHKACKARHQNEKRHHPWRERDTHCYNSFCFSKLFPFMARIRASGQGQPALTGQHLI